MDNQKMPKMPKKFICEKCDFVSCKLSNFNKHLQTKKHMDNQKITKNVHFCLCGKTYKYLSGLSKHKKRCTYKKNDTDVDNWIKMDKKWIKMDKSEKCPFSYICECGKSYKYQSGLSKHKKICPAIQNKQKDTICDKEFVLKLLEKNDELVDKIVEMSKEPKTIHNTTNNQFNVMNYLNTECKDAINFSDFINDFVFSLDDLNLLHEKGYQEAMEQTFIKQLQDMDKTKRPIHCSDKKRKSFYIKDKDIWIKDENNLKILDGVKEITHKQFGAIKQWANYNKDWLDVEKKQDFFNMSVCELSKAKKEKYLNKLIIKLTTLSLK
jgi:hypothetical protein